MSFESRHYKQRNSRAEPDYFAVVARIARQCICIGALCALPANASAQSKAQEAAATNQLQPTPPPEAASRVLFSGNEHFPEDQLRQPLADPLLSIQNQGLDRKSTRLNSSHTVISYAVFCLKKKKHITPTWCVKIETVMA